MLGSRSRLRNGSSSTETLGMQSTLDVVMDSSLCDKRLGQHGASKNLAEDSAYLDPLLVLENTGWRAGRTARGS